MSSYDDLYGDLPEETTIDQIAKLENENRDLQEKYDSSQKELEKVAAENNQLKTENHDQQNKINNLEKKIEDLENNISSLYMTAVAESKRKDNLLAELRAEHDNIAFRRRENQHERCVNHSRDRSRDHKNVHDRHRNRDTSSVEEKLRFRPYDKVESGSYSRRQTDRNHKYDDRRRNEIKTEKRTSSEKSDHRSNELYDQEKYLNSRTKLEIKIPRLKNDLEPFNNYAKISNGCSRKMPGDKQIEDKRNCFDQNDLRKNDHICSSELHDQEKCHKSGTNLEIKVTRLKNDSEPFNSSDKISYRCPRKIQSENRIEDKRNSFDQNDLRGNDHRNSSSESHDQEKILKSRMKEIKDPRLKSNAEPLNSSDKISNKCLRKIPSDYQIEDKRNSSDQNDHRSSSSESHDQEKHLKSRMKEIKDPRLKSNGEPLNSSDKISNRCLRKIPSDYQIEDKRNSSDQNDHRSSSSESHVQHLKSRMNLEAIDLRLGSNAEPSNNSDKISNRCPQKIPNDNQIEDKRNSFDQNNLRRNELHDHKLRSKTLENEEKPVIVPRRTETSLPNLKTCPKEQNGSRCNKNDLRNQEKHVKSQVKPIVTKENVSINCDIRSGNSLGAKTCSNLPNATVPNQTNNHELRSSQEAAKLPPKPLEKSIVMKEGVFNGQRYPPNLNNSPMNGPPKPTVQHPNVAASNQMKTNESRISQDTTKLLPKPSENNHIPTACVPNRKSNPSKCINPSINGPPKSTELKTNKNTKPLKVPESSSKTKSDPAKVTEVKLNNATKPVNVSKNPANVKNDPPKLPLVKNDSLKAKELKNNPSKIPEVKNNHSADPCSEIKLRSITENRPETLTILNLDDASNKTLYKTPAKNLIEEILGQKYGCSQHCEAALLSMKKLPWKLVTPIKDTPDLLKEKFSHIESNKINAKIPMINEQRMLSPFKNVGRVEIVSGCADEDEPSKSASSEVAAACVTVTEDVEHGIFVRKSRKRPKKIIIVENVKKIALSS